MAHLYNKIPVAVTADIVCIKWRDVPGLVSQQSGRVYFYVEDLCTGPIEKSRMVLDIYL